MLGRGRIRTRWPRRLIPTYIVYVSKLLAHLPYICSMTSFDCGIRFCEVSHNTFATKIDKYNIFKQVKFNTFFECDLYFTGFLLSKRGSNKAATLLP